MAEFIDRLRSAFSDSYRIESELGGGGMSRLFLADEIGLDTVLNYLELLLREIGDTKYRPCPLLRKKVRAGHLGKRVGQGFYRY